MENLAQYQLHRHIVCIDLKCFYATVECVLRGLDPFTTPLVVADKSRGKGSIVLAISPFLKSFGIPSRCRFFELPPNANIIVAKPQMQTYLEYATKVIGIYLEFVSDEDLYVYSIDECFLDLTHYLTLYKKTDREIVGDILNKITSTIGLYATAGIGPNMLMAKLALDIDGKKAKDYIAQWSYDDIKTKLWPVYPLSKMWSIGHRMEKHLNALGLYHIGDIAQYDKMKLKKAFGVLGLELWYHTHGIDMSLVADKDKLRIKHKSFANGQILFRDYDANEALTIILEMVDEVTRRLRLSKKQARTIHLSIGYSRQYGGGFSRQLSLEQPTQHESTIYKTCLQLFDQLYEGYPIRTVSIALSNLTDNHFYQFSLFEDPEALTKEFAVQQTIDTIKAKYGKNKINRASSELSTSTVKQRNQQIGGHNSGV